MFHHFSVELPNQLKTSLSEMTSQANKSTDLNMKRQTLINRFHLSLPFEDLHSMLLKQTLDTLKTEEALDRCHLFLSRGTDESEEQQQQQPLEEELLNSKYLKSSEEMFAAFGKHHQVLALITNQPAWNPFL